MRELAEIKALCEKYRTQPKILLIPSRRMKTQILKLLADNGIGPLNLQKHRMTFIKCMSRN